MTHSNSNLGADDVRQYRIRTTGTVGSVTVHSDWAYALASENYPAPGAPRDFTARANSDTSVTLTWTSPEAVAGVISPDTYWRSPSTGARTGLRWRTRQPWDPAQLPTPTLTPTTRCRRSPGNTG